MNPTNKAKLSALAALFVGFPRQEREGTEKQLLEVYLMAIEGVSSDFIAMACKRFIQGQVEGASMTFRPTPAQLAAECRRLQNKALDHERLSNLRLAKPEEPEVADPTPEERQRCAEMWAQAKREIEAAAHSARMPKKGKYGPAVPDYTPKFDVSDFPPSNASPQELRDWEARQKVSAA